MLSNLLESVLSVLSRIGNEIGAILEFTAPDLPWILFVFLIIAAWLGSGFFAATVAELFGHRVFRHFVFGLFLPYLYPIWLAGHITRSEQAVQASQEEEAAAWQAARQAAASDRFAEMRTRRAARRGQAIEAPAGELPPGVPVSEETADGEEEPAFDLKSELYELPVDESGERPVYLRFYMKGGASVDVVSVRALQDEFMIGVVAGTGKAIRIRYDNVETVENLSE